MENPRVGLLNIGEEPEKGNELAVESHKLLMDSELNFIGNIEGREIIRGGCDVLVCDGFDGNLILKFYESVAEFIIGLLKKELKAHHADELDLNEIFRFLDYEEEGGAPLLGVNGVSIIMHGSSRPKASRMPSRWRPGPSSRPWYPTWPGSWPREQATRKRNGKTPETLC